MNRVALALIVFHWLAGGIAAAELKDPPALPYARETATSPVESVKYEWHDEKRNRNVPVKIYYPAKGSGPWPVIIFSHGLGGSRDGYDYLGRYWASHGYVSVHPQHLGSDEAVWRDAAPEERMAALTRAVMNIQNAIERPRDISFTIDKLDKLNRQDGVFKGKLDLRRLGVGGHSFGAYTTLAVAGQVFFPLWGGEVSAPDPRVKAGIAMSSSVPRNKETWDKSFAKIKIPIFHMTGTRDDSPFGDTKAAERRVPFDRMSGVDEYLVNFEGGDHMIFSGRLSGMGDASKDAAFQRLIVLGSTAFWDAYLKEDAAAKKWLSGGGYEGAVKGEAKFEEKLK